MNPEILYEMPSIKQGKVSLGHGIHGDAFGWGSNLLEWRDHIGLDWVHVPETKTTMVLQCYKALAMLEQAREKHEQSSRSKVTRMSWQEELTSDGGDVEPAHQCRELHSCSQQIKEQGAQSLHEIELGVS